eukprot:gnl/Chilomastix_caulleri/5388.p1 GENE.gnl/Chilomastix_caulleri/5388~~gnl/Chilomastix_caulleri/5388.p1  ORF type:complete len:177 (+),score=45.04 gnl/Chilomastix_caulleri/5388:18-548(+)
MRMPGGGGENDYSKGRVIVTGSIEAIIEAVTEVRTTAQLRRVNPYVRIHIDQLGIVDSINIFQAVEMKNSGQVPMSKKQGGSQSTFSLSKTHIFKPRYGTMASIYPLLPLIKGILGLPATLLGNMPRRYETGEIPCLLDYLLSPAIFPMLSKEFRAMYAAVLRRASALPSIKGIIE